MNVCHRCGHAWSGPDAPGFNNTCEGCGIALHACANCEHYRPKGEVRCALPDTDRILDAVAPNRCSAFRFRTSPGLNELQAEASADAPADDRNARDRWDELFGA